MRQAIEKINEEMQKDPTNEYMEIIGHYIIDRCTDETTAAAVLAEGKTLIGVLENINERARKKAKNNCAVISDDVVFKWVDEYFGFDSVVITPPSEPTQGLNLDFDSLLM